VFLKTHLLGMTLFSVGTGIIATLLYDNASVIWNAYDILISKYEETKVARTPTSVFYREDRADISGYFVASCSNCGRPRAWAFNWPKEGDRRPEFRRNPLPAAEFLYPDDKPRVGYCVNFPKGVCPDNWAWNPTHNLETENASFPSLRVTLSLVISGFVLNIVNEGGTTARGINVAVVAWQTGAPGADIGTDYELKDLPRWADTSIEHVFENRPSE
jgi:hypothetical protein